MSSISKYPSSASQENTGQQCEWGNAGAVPSYITAEDGATAQAKNNGGSCGTTYKLIGVFSGFDIPNNAKITGVKVDIRYANSTPSGSGCMKVHAMSMSSLDAYKSVQNVAFIPGTNTSSMKTWTLGGPGDLLGFPDSPAYFNSAVTMKYWATVAPGYVSYVDYFKLTVYYTLPTYSLAVGVDSEKVVGEDVEYKIEIENTNKIHQGNDIPISITIPAGLNYVSQSGNGTFNPVSGKWNATLINNKASLTLILESTTSGLKTIAAEIDDFDISISRNTNILSPSYTLESDLPENVTQGQNITFDVTVETDTAAVSSVEVYVEIPTGFSYVSSTGSGSYNSGTKIWTASFTNKSATRSFTLTAVTPEIYSQTVSITGKVALVKTILIVSASVTEPFYTIREIPEEILNNMEDGGEYTLSCYSKISDSSLSEVYKGLKNFKIAVVSRIKSLVAGNVGTGTDTLKTTTGFVPNAGASLYSYYSSSFGSQALRVDSIGVNTGFCVYPRPSVKPNTTYIIRFKVLIPAVGTYQFRGMVRVYNSTPAIIQTVVSDNTFNNGINYVTMQITTAADAASLDILGLSYQAASYTFYIDEIIPIEGTEIPDFEEMDLLSGDLILSDESLGSRVAELDIIERIFVNFINDASKPLAIKEYGQYREISPATATNRFFGFALHEGSDIEYEDPGIPFETMAKLIIDEDFTTVVLESGEKTNPILFEDINLSGRESDPDLIVKGIGVSFDYFITGEIGAVVTIMTGDESNKKSVVLDPDGSSIIIGGETDKWDLKNIDLTDISFLLKFDNISADTQTLQLKNVEFILYSQHDETRGNLGFTLDGEHSRNYNMFITKGFDKTEGLVKEIDTLALKKMDGELITGVSNKSKTITVPFYVIGDNLEDMQERLTDAVKNWLSNDLDAGKRPISKTLIFDWDPDREYEVVLLDAVSVAYETGKMECEAQFLLPRGVATTTRITGASDINNGLTSVKPLITFKANGSETITLNESISGQSLTLNKLVPEDKILIFDCENRKIYSQLGPDLEAELDNLVDPNIATATGKLGNTTGFSSVYSVLTSSTEIVDVKTGKTKSLKIDTNNASSVEGYIFNISYYPDVTAGKKYVARVRLYGVSGSGVVKIMFRTSGGGGVNSVQSPLITFEGTIKEIIISGTAQETAVKADTYFVTTTQQDINVFMLETVFLEGSEMPEGYLMDSETGNLIYIYDYTEYITLNSDLLMINPGRFDFAESEGCTVQKVEFKEGS